MNQKEMAAFLPVTEQDGQRYYKTNEANLLNVFQSLVHQGLAELKIETPREPLMVIQLTHNVEFPFDGKIRDFQKDEYLALSLDSKRGYNYTVFYEEFYKMMLPEWEMSNMLEVKIAKMTRACPPEYTGVSHGGARRKKWFAFFRAHTM